MPNTRASKRRRVSKHKPRKETATSSDDDYDDSHSYEDAEAEPEISIMDKLREVSFDLKRVLDERRSLERENKRLKTELQDAQENAVGRRTRLGSREKTSQRQIQSLERKIIALEAAREKDRLTIEKLRDKEVKREAQELTADEDGNLPTQEPSDLDGTATELLRRVCDTIDMNTLAEAEECAICMEEMVVEKCYSLPCRHPVCAGCFEQLGDGSSLPAKDRTAVQCPHCREIYPRPDCEIITHTAVQQWDILLEISQQWAARDVGELGVGDDDDSVAATESLRRPDSPAEAVDLDISTAFTSPNDNRPVAYGNLPSPMKRKVLTRLAEQRAIKQRI